MISYFLIIYFINVGVINWLIILSLLPIPFGLFNMYNSGIFLGKNDINTFNKINWIPSAVVAVLMFIFLIGLRMGVEGAMLATVGGPLFMFVVLIFRNDFLGYLSMRFNWAIIKQMLNLGSVYATALFVINLN